MGQQQSQQSIALQQVNNYSIVSALTNGTVLLKHKTNHEQLILRVLTSTVEDEMVNYEKLLRKRQKVKNPHLLELRSIQNINENRRCTMTYKLQLLVEYPFKCLYDEVLERKHSNQPNPFFSEEQLWSVLYSCCYGMHTLYANKISHESLTSRNIFINRQGIIKVADPMALGLQKNYIQLMKQEANRQTTEQRYISPELVNLIEDNNFYYYDKQKSDVFILAIIILEAAILSKLQVYDCTTKKVDFHIVISTLKMFQQKYSGQITKILEDMLNSDPKTRPSFQQLMELIEQHSEIDLQYEQNSSRIQNNSKNNIKDQTNSTKKLEKQPQFIISQKLISKNQNNLQYFADFNQNRAAILSQQEQKVLNVDRSERYLIKQETYTHQNNHYQNNQFLFPRDLTSTPSYALFNQTIPLHSNFNTTINNNISNNYYQNQQENANKQPYLNQVPITKKTINANQVQNESNIYFNPNLFGYSPYQKLQIFNQKNQQKIIETNNLQNTELKQKSLIRETQINFQKYSLKNNAVLINNLIQNQDQKMIVKKQQRNQERVQRFSENKFGKINLIPLFQQIKSNKNQTSQTIIKEQNQKIQRKSIEKNKNNNKQQQTYRNKHSTFVIEEISGAKYEGHKVDGKRQGTGRLFFEDGGYFEGEWRQNQMDGYGKLYYEDKSIAYEGFWSKDEFSGYGKVYNDQPHFENSEYDFSDWTKIGNRWLSYQGEFKNDSKHGKGVMKLSNGERFEGRFYIDEVEGQGRFYKQDGTIISATWKDNHIIPSSS